MAGALFFATVRALALITPNLEVGTTIRVQGVTGSTGEAFVCNIYNDAPTFRGGDAALHISYRPNEGSIVRNSYIGGKWGPEEREGGFKTYPNKPFDIKIVVGKVAFEITINGVKLPDYKYRTNLNDIKFALAYGDGNVDSAEVYKAECDS